MKISLDNAKEEKLFYFVVTGIIYRESDKRCLILQRATSEKVYPGLWGVVGGKLEWKDLDKKKITRINNGVVPDWEGMIEDLLYRETLEESGLKVCQPKYIASVAFIRPDNVPVICAKFGLKYKSGKVTYPLEFINAAWVNAKEIKKYKFIAGIDQEIAATIKAYGKP